MPDLFACLFLLSMFYCVSYVASGLVDPATRLRIIVTSPIHARLRVGFDNFRSARRRQGGERGHNFPRPIQFGWFPLFAAIIFSFGGLGGGLRDDFWKNKKKLHDGTRTNTYVYVRVRVRACRMLPGTVTWQKRHKWYASFTPIFLATARHADKTPHGQYVAKIAFLKVSKKAKKKEEVLKECNIIYILHDCHPEMWRHCVEGHPLLKAE